MSSELDDKIRDAEPAEKGLTNELYFTDSRVIKVYSKYPVTSFLESFTELLNGKLTYLDRTQRIENELRTKEVIRDLGFNSPEVVDRGEDYLCFERISGSDLFSVLRSSEGETAYTLGNRIGDFLEEIHRQDLAIKDFRVSNIHIDKEEELYFIDHEYSRLEANRLMKKTDQLTLFSSVRQTGNFSSFLAGFKESKNDLSYFALILSIFVFGYHAILFERSIRNFSNGMKSIFVF